MLSRVTNQVTSFFKKEQPQQRFIQPFTRFSSAVELKGIAEILEKIHTKKEGLKKIADEKGAGSDEFATYEILDHLLNVTRDKISEFNGLDIKRDIYSNIKDMCDLTAQLKAIITVTEKDKEALNSVTIDKPIAKNATLGAALVATPVVALAVIGSGGLALLAGVGALALMKPANDYLTQAKVITWDTESKELVLSFIDTVNKTNVNLSKYLAENAPAQDGNKMSALKLV